MIRGSWLSRPLSLLAICLLVVSVVGALMVSGSLYSLNQYLAATGYQTMLFELESWFLSLVR